MEDVLKQVRKYEGRYVKSTKVALNIREVEKAQSAVKYRYIVVIHRMWNTIFNPGRLFVIQRLRIARRPAKHQSLLVGGCVLSSGVRPWFEHFDHVQLLADLRLGCQIGKDGSRQSAAGEVGEETWLPLEEEKNLVASSLIWSSCLFQHGAWFFSHKFEWTRISCTASSSSFSSFKKNFFFLLGR